MAITYSCTVSLSNTVSRAEDQSSNLDALATFGVGPGSGVLKGSVRYAPLDIGVWLQGMAVEALEQETLAASHAAEVVPLLLRILADGSRPAAVTVWISVLNGNDILVLDRGGRCHGKGERFNRTLVERTPDIDNTVAALKKLAGLVREVSTDTLSRGVGGLVNMNTGHRGALRVRTTDGVIEDVDAIGARDVIQEELFNLRIVLFLNGLVVEELSLVGWGDVLDDLEGVLVKVEGGLVAANVVDDSVVGGVGEVALRLTLGRSVDEVEGLSAVNGRFVEVEGCGDVAAGYG